MVPYYDERIEACEAIDNLFTALYLLTDWRGSNTTRYFIAADHQYGRVPYILIEGFYNNGDYAGSELIRLSDEVADGLMPLTTGDPRWGYTDEMIRSLSGRGRKHRDDLTEELTEKLRQSLKSGVSPGHHGWSRQYRSCGVVCARLWPAFNSIVGPSDIEIPSGIQFKNPLQEAWVVDFDETVLELTVHEAQWKALCEERQAEQRAEQLAVLAHD